MTTLTVASPVPMDTTRLALFYPVAYLLGGGLALLLAPRLAMSLLLSSGEYGDIFPRYIGAMRYFGAN